MRQVAHCLIFRPIARGRASPDAATGTFWQPAGRRRADGVAPLCRGKDPGGNRAQAGGVAADGEKAGAQADAYGKLLGQFLCTSRAVAEPLIPRTCQLSGPFREYGGERGSHFEVSRRCRMAHVPDKWLAYQQLSCLTRLHADAPKCTIVDSSNGRLHRRCPRRRLKLAP